MRIEVAARAEADVLAAFDYLNAHNPKAARAIRSAVRRAILSLRSMPERGRPTPVVGVRELPVRSAPYVIVYKVFDDRVAVLRVRHLAQDRSGGQSPG